MANPLLTNIRLVAMRTALRLLTRFPEYAQSTPPYTKDELAAVAAELLTEFDWTVDEDAHDDLVLDAEFEEVVTVDGEDVTDGDEMDAAYEVGR